MQGINGTTRKCLPDSSTTTYSTTALTALQKKFASDYNTIWGQLHHKKMFASHALLIACHNCTVKKIAGLHCKKVLEVMQDINGTTRKCLPDSSTTTYNTTAVSALQKSLQFSAF